MLVSGSWVDTGEARDAIWKSKRWKGTQTNHRLLTFLSLKRVILPFCARAYAVMASKTLQDLPSSSTRAHTLPMSKRASLLDTMKTFRAFSRTEIIISHPEMAGETRSLGRTDARVRPSARPSLNVKLLGGIRAGECILPARAMLQEWVQGCKPKTSGQS